MEHPSWNDFTPRTTRREELLSTIFWPFFQFLFFGLLRKAYWTMRTSDDSTRFLPHNSPFLLRTFWALLFNWMPFYAFGIRTFLGSHRRLCSYAQWTEWRLVVCFRLSGRWHGSLLFSCSRNSIVLGVFRFCQEWRAVLLRVQLFWLEFVSRFFPVLGLLWDVRVQWSSL